MSQPSDSGPPLVKPLAAVLFRQPQALAAGLASLTRALSPVDFQGPTRAFDRSSYYEPEMGAGLSRCLVSFSRLQPAPFLAGAKLAAAEAERTLAVGGNRTVNLDPGYLDLGKVVLASFKGRDHKLYLEQGVWADITLHFRVGRFHPLPWSFPDFGEGAFDSELEEIRRIFKGQLRESGGG